jgi:RimJ/RimL family protein N-acetyltransferase
MIELVPMTEDDFAEFRAYTLTSFAHDKVQSGQWMPQEAQQNASIGFQKLLPEGMATANHFFYSLVDPELSQSVGYIWFQIRGEGTGRDAFIFDHVIHEKFRNRGYGSQTHQAIDAKLLAMKVERVSTHVAAHNTTPLRLLERVGYRVTGIDLSKRLREGERG